jgi:hypothetical protein
MPVGISFSPPRHTSDRPYIPKWMAEENEVLSLIAADIKYFKEGEDNPFTFLDFFGRPVVAQHPLLACSEAAVLGKGAIFVVDTVPKREDGFGVFPGKDKILRGFEVGIGEGASIFKHASKEHLSADSRVEMEGHSHLAR